MLCLIFNIFLNLLIWKGVIKLDNKINLAHSVIFSNIFLVILGDIIYSHTNERSRNVRLKNRVLYKINKSSSKTLPVHPRIQEFRQKINCLF